MAGGQGEPDRQAAGIDAGVELGAQSATRAADGVIRLPFLRLAAYWCACTIELSISASEPDERAASAPKIVSHTPRLAQPLKRFYAVLCGPYRSGRSRQGVPVRSTKKIAFICRDFDLI